MASRSLSIALCACLLIPAGARAAKARKKPAGEAADLATATLTGTVVIKGRIKKVKKAFNPYADIYGGGSGLAAKKADEPGHLAVYLDGEAGAPTPPASRPGSGQALSAAEGPSDHGVLNQRERQFTTDLLPVLAGTSVDFTNEDRIFHNVFSYSQPQPFDLGRRAGGEKRTVTFSKLPPSGIGVIKVACEIHSNMHATVLVMRNPYWAVLPETGGEFTIREVPPGTYTLTGWHLSLAPVPVRLTLKPGATEHVTLVMQGEE